MRLSYRGRMWLLSPCHSHPIPINRTSHTSRASRTPHSSCITTMTLTSNTSGHDTTSAYQPPVEVECLFQLARIWCAPEALIFPFFSMLSIRVPRVDCRSFNTSSLGGKTGEFGPAGRGTPPPGEKKLCHNTRRLGKIVSSSIRNFSPPRLTTTITAPGESLAEGL
jgi:hypothetical protein